MAFTAAVGLNSPSRTPAKLSQCPLSCSSPVRPNSPYSSAHSPSRVHSPCTRALQRSASHLSNNSCTGQTAALSSTMKQLQLAPFASSSGSSHTNRALSSVVCHSSNGNQPADWDAAHAPSSPIQRPTSPVSTANACSPTAAAAAASSTTTYSQHTNNWVPEQQPQHSSAAGMVPAAAAVLPSVDLTASSTAAEAKAAAEAQAAVTATMSVADLDSQQLGDAGQPAQAQVQEVLTLLQFQVKNDFSESAICQTLISLVKSAAADQVPLAFLMTHDNLKLWQVLLVSDPQVAVLAAETLCRVCSQDLQPWTGQITKLLPTLLHVVKYKGAGPAAQAGSTAHPASSKQVPLLFFTISALVRLSGVEELAAEIVRQAGVQDLVEVLDIRNAAICQVTTFALFRLMREIDGDLADDELINWPASSNSNNNTTGIDHSGSSASTGQELLLVQYVKQGAFSKLCAVLGTVEEGSAHDLAFSMLLSMSIIPEVAQLVADRSEISCIVKVITHNSRASIRLEAMLVLARLAARHTPCQQDAVREGVVPVLVQLIQQSTDEDRCHAARLLAILGQHASTHQIILDSGALSVALRILGDRGHHRVFNNVLPTHLQPTHTPDGRPLDMWEAAQAIYNTAVAAGMSGAAASSAAAAGVAAAVAEGGGQAEQQRAAVQSYTINGHQHSPAQQQHLPRPTVQVSPGNSRQPSTGGSSRSSSSGGAGPSSSAVSSTSGGIPIGPALVLEQAAGVVCMLSHNLDNHFKMVGQGVVPLLVPLLHKDTLTKTLSYTLASLLMLAVGEPRHAAVIARTGAVPGLVSVVGDAAVRSSNREMAAALLAVLCRSRDVQEDVVGSGGILALIRLVSNGSEGGRCYGCEALSQIAAASDARCRQVLRAQVLVPLRTMLQPSCSCQSILWAASLLQVLSRDATCLREICAVSGLIPLIPEVLSRVPTEPMPATDNQGTATSPPNAMTAQRQSSSGGSSRRAVDGSREPTMPEIPVVNVLGNLSSRDNEEEGSVGVPGKEPAGCKDTDLEKAQSSMAWLVAALATDQETRPLIAELGNFLVKPLVVILRDAQAGQGSGYTLTEVLEGITNSRQAAAVAALRSMSQADDRLAAAINAEITVQLWMGHRVELPRVDDDWPFAPSWYLKDG